jgi:hypothetical protein
MTDRDVAVGGGGGRAGWALAAAAALMLPGCAGAGDGIGEGAGLGGYSLVRVKPTRVGDGSLVVTPPREWNRQWSRLFVDVRDVEDWTQNGPVLDTISFVSGLKGNSALVRQYRTTDRQVPRFQSTMAPQEVAAMLESLFRVRLGTVEFRTTALAPRDFLGTRGFQFDFEHLDGDELWRRGRAVGAIVDGKLYLVMLDSARSHYFAAAERDFEAIVASAVRTR